MLADAESSPYMDSPLPPLEDFPVLPIWLRYILPIPVLVLLVLFPGITFRAAWRGQRKESELHVRWPWWRRP